MGEDSAARAHERWPTLRRVHPAEFLLHWASLRGPRERAHRHGAELFLTFESARACDAAIRILDAHFFGDARRTIRRLCGGSAATDDVQQAVWERLLTGERPKILSYSGDGPLEHWLCGVARRLTLNTLRGRRPRRTELCEWEAARPTSPAIADSLHERVLTALQGALDRAFQTLTDRERELLKLHYVRRLTLPELSQRLGTHRATTARWLSAARLRVFDAATLGIMSELQLSRADAQALWRERYEDLEAPQSTG